MDLPVDGPLSDRLEACLQGGSMSFRDWMAACLYDEAGGYYMGPRRKTGTGDDADFATSPTLHPFMAQCIARDILTTWEDLGRPDGFGVWEFGGGEGVLARDALAWLRDHTDLELVWTHVEISPDHRAKQDKEPQTNIQWAAGLPEQAVGVVVAHEFLDALPFHVLERRKGAWAEVRVKRDEDPASEGGFVACHGMPSRAAIEAAPVSEHLPDGQRVAAMAEAKAWIEELASRLQGAVLAVDYGAEHVWRRDREGTVRTFAHQQDGGSPLEGPGTKDITASVDFALVRQWAEAAGLHAEPLLSQEAYLLEHGALEALNAQERDTVEGASAYLRLRQLILPTAMGQAFQVQILRTPVGNGGAS